MSEDNKPQADQPQTQDAPPGSAMPITVHAQYVRDISFENPNTPEMLRAGQDQPNMDVNIGMDARKIEDDQLENLYEVVLNVRAEAMRGDDIMFIAELQYGITLTLNGVPEDQHHPLLLIEIPKLAFPYARQILSDLTVQGGYPPLLLTPVDFHALYLDQFKDEIAKAQKEQQAAQADAAKASEESKSETIN